MQTDPDLFSQEIATLDRAVERVVPGLWVGAEPTFTLRSSERPEWLSEPLGGDKERLAQGLVARLRECHPGAVVLRTLGRQYPGETRPRWCIGLYESRDGGPVWHGPPDPLVAETGACDSRQLQAFVRRLIAGLTALGWPSREFRCEAEMGHRILFRPDGKPLRNPDSLDPRWLRESLHRQAIPHAGLVDDLMMDEGECLLAIGLQAIEQGNACAVLELPDLQTVDGFRALLTVLGEAAEGLPGLILQGFPPPVDASVAWTSVTPDPAVIEINQAPYADCRRFLAASRELYGISQAIGLSPYRLQYNGTESDSGGGGQLTLGGERPETSPFLTRPNLLPRLLRYFIRHPALSYWFGPDYLGGSSQSPRPDEGMRGLFHELRLALFHLERLPSPEPEFIWRSLAPFLSDSSGNSHRSDLNIEKLWNPYLPGRGRQGLVEFRAFRMATTPQRAAAMAALLRALVALLATCDVSPGLADWGDELHERFALPYYLRRDLLSVFADLQAADIPFGGEIRRRLLSDTARTRWQLEFNGCRLSIERALEFWPLVGGDAHSQESGGSRLVDASTARWQLLLRPAAGADQLDFQGWMITSEDLRIPLRYESDEQGQLAISGIRLREFEPWIGLHPAVEPRMPLCLILSHVDLPEALEVRLHGWQPEGLPYAGLPIDQADALARREERLTTRRLPASTLAKPLAPPSESLSDYGIDLRWLVD